MSQPGRPVRLAELIAVLSLATDLGLGQPMEYLLRTCLLAMDLGEALQLDAAGLHDVYYSALLRWIGCTAHAHEASLLYGDEQVARARLALVDLGDQGAVLLDALAHVGDGRTMPARLRTLLGALALGPRKGPELQFRASCEAGRNLATRLGIGDGVVAALAAAFERWDGSGFPDRTSGTAIPIAMRIVLIAQDAVAFEREGGAAFAIANARQQSGRAYDPAVAAALIDGGSDLFDRLQVDSAWEAALDAEPSPLSLVQPADLDRVLEVFADFTDLKSPFTPGHSRKVAALVSGAAGAGALDPSEATRLRRAALVHDLGRLGVPNNIWDKRGPLNSSEWERVRLYPYLTSRMLARSEALAELGAWAASHRERLDGSGYHRGVAGSALSYPERILACADAFQAMCEPRAHRAALARDASAAELRLMGRNNLLDPRAVEAVIAASGQKSQREARWPAGLTDREVEVLRCAARGSLNKETARTLGISERTVAHHLQHVYDKIGVSTRGAAALFAIENGLL